MTENLILQCPVCGKEIINTRNSVQPYNDFDDYLGFRCSGCKKTFTEAEIAAIMNASSP
jgi:DNA-directed RNA polymerase subunit RPC12/RpoP